MPRDITVLQSGEIFYTDNNRRTMNKYEEYKDSDSDQSTGVCILSFSVVPTWVTFDCYIQ